MDDELALHAAGKIRGSAFAVTNKQYTEMVDVGAQVPHGKVAGMKRVWSVEAVDEAEEVLHGGGSLGAGGRGGGEAKPAAMKRVASYQAIKPQGAAAIEPQ